MKRLKNILNRHSGRAFGTVVVRHQGGGEKQFMRMIDFKRINYNVWGIVEDIEYDPGRSADIARVIYSDGTRAYVLAPVDLKIGAKIVSAEEAPIEAGNSVALKNIPVGVSIHNIEITHGKGGQMVKSAGSAATVFGHDDNWVLVKLPSGEIRRFNPESFASIGQIGNIEAKERVWRKAGIMRHRGIRPTVRGVAMNPDSHPHGGGEGRSGIGMPHPKTVYGRSAVGKTRNKTKYSNYLIVQRKGGKALIVSK